MNNLKNANFYTRIHVLADDQAVRDALSSTPALRNTTSLLTHYSDVLLFHHDEQQHITDMRALLQMLQDRDIQVDIDLCAFSKPSWTEAGFYIRERAGFDGRRSFKIILREKLTEKELEAIDRRL